MKNYLYKILGSVAMVGMLFTTACDKTYVDEAIPMAPSISSFSPESGPVGSKIAITGESLNDVSVAKIGGVEVTILEKVSSSAITLLADIEGVSGKITLENSVGECLSESSFTYVYDAPTLQEDRLQVNVVMGENMLLSGENLSAITAVYLASEQTQKEYAAEISSQSNREIVARVPYVDCDDARIVLEYKTGDSSEKSSYESAPVVSVRRDRPEFDDASWADSYDVGRSMTLTGKYLNKVDRITFNGNDAVISTREMERIVFTVPAAEEFVDGANTVELVAIFFDGNEQTVLNPTLTVYVPLVKFWENISTYAQGREAEVLASFFSPETGVVYANSRWQELDAVSVAYSGAVGDTNAPIVTEEEYNSVVPYFFFSTLNAGDIMINSPGNSNSQLKNFFSTTLSNSSVTGGGSWRGTPAMAFHWVDPASANPAEAELFTKIKSGDVENIDEATFPIDVTNKLVAGVQVSMSGAPKSSVWAPGMFFKGTDYPGAEVDAVFLVLYYNYLGAGDNKTENVKRIGFVHLRTVDYLHDSNSYPRSSKFTFDCYWQKYDYDYSKIVLDAQ